MSTIRMTGLVSGLDTESIIEQLVSAQSLKNKKVSDKLTLSEWKEEKWKELNTELYELYSNTLSKLRLPGTYNSKAVSLSNDDLVSVSAGSSATVGTHTLKINSLASAQYATSGVIYTDESTSTKATSSTNLNEDLGMSIGDTITFTSADSTETLTVDEDTTLADVISAAKSAGLNASYDEDQGRIFISSSDSGSANSFQISGSNLDKIGLDEIDENGDVVIAEGSTQVSTVVKAADSEITYNGATITGTSNTITVNGMTITLKGETSTGETISLTVSNNAEENYNLVKEFISSYNDILEEMNDLYYADSASDYEPLTDDEKSEMSDEEIEKWETKIKDSILRRDSTLGSLIDSMKSAMMSSVTIDGKTYSLTTFGITTSSDYTEKGLLHIYGDSEDSTYSTMEDKLEAAFTDDPETTIEALSSIFSNLYTTMTEKSSSISNVRSAYTFYNDKLLDNEQTEYSEQIETLEEKLEDMEERYYEKFSAMETALATLQAQSDALSSLLGTSS